MKRFVLLLVTLLFSAFALAAVNINTATKEELDALPEIGPVKAQAIVDYRTKNGPFKTPEDIMKVSGIKEGTYAKIKGMISVTGATTPRGRPARRPKPKPRRRRAPRTSARIRGAGGASPGTRAPHLPQRHPLLHLPRRRRRTQKLMPRPLPRRRRPRRKTPR